MKSGVRPNPPEPPWLRAWNEKIDEETGEVAGRGAWFSTAARARYASLLVANL